MKNKREKKVLNKAERLARKGLIKETIIVYFVILLAIILLLSSSLSFYTNVPGFTIYTFLKDFGATFVIPLIIYVVSIPGFWFLRKSEHIQMAYKKVRADFSKQLAEKLLIPGKPTDVILKNTKDGYYTDYILGLQSQNICQFYVILEKNGVSISIYSKSKEKNKEDLFFDSITKEEFTFYCELPG